MKIEKMTEVQVNEVKALLDLCFGSSSWSAENLKSELNRSDSVCTLAEIDGRVVGFLAFEQILDEGSVIEVAVHPDFRRQGIAKALIKNMLTACVGLSCVFLEVRESNSAAVHLYRSLGFEEIAVRKNYYDSPVENAVIMRLSIG